MKRSSIILFVFLIILLPEIANARTLDEAKAIMNKIGVVENTDGSCVLNVQSKPFEQFTNDLCEYSYEEYLEEYDWLYEDRTEEEKRAAYEEQKKYCKKDIILDILTIDYQTEEWVNYDYTNNLNVEYLPNTQSISIDVRYDDSFYTKTCKVSYSSVDESIIKKGVEYANKTKQLYYGYGIQSLVLSYYLGSNFSESNLPELEDLVRLNGIKEYSDSLEEGYSLNVHAHPQMRMVMDGLSGTTIIYNNGVAVGAQHEQRLMFGLSLVPVSKNAKGTTEEKARQRIKDTFGDSVEFSMNIIGEADPNDTINYWLGTENVDYNAIVTHITINNKTISGVIFFELDDEKVDKYTASAKDKKTGVRVKSNSYEVPSDIELTIENVRDKDYVKKAVKDKYTMLSAYDVTLSTIMSMTGNITEIKNGLQIYIPIKDKKLGEKLLVQHIKEDGTFGDSYDGVVVELDGTKYVKFTTTHLSTFAVYEQIKEGEKNPETADYITMIVIGIPIICLAMLNILPKLKKNRYE